MVTQFHFQPNALTSDPPGGKQEPRLPTAHLRAELLFSPLAQNPSLYTQPHSQERKTPSIFHFSQPVTVVNWIPWITDTKLP